MPGGNPSPFPTPENLRRPWQKGESGNPSGVSREQQMRQIVNAEEATRARTRLLAALNKRLDSLEEAGEDAAVSLISADILRLIKDSEDRGLGTAAQNVHLGRIGGNDGQAIDLRKLDTALLERILDQAYGPLIEGTAEDE